MNTGTSFADAIPLQNRVGHEITTLLDRQKTYFSFNVVQGKRLRFKAVASDGGDTFAELYHYLGTIIATDDDSGGTRNPLIDIIPNYTGIMYGSIRSYSANITVRCIVSYDSEDDGTGGGGEVVLYPGESFGNAVEIEVGVNTDVFLNAAERQRYLLFNCEVGTSYVFRTYGTFDAYALLYDGSMSLLRQDDDGAGDRNPLIKFTAPTPIMFVLLRGYNSPTSHTNIIVSMKVDDPSLVSGVRITPDHAYMGWDKQLQLRATIEPPTSINKNVTWSIEPESLATIDQTGLVTSIPKGEIDGAEVLVTVITEDGGYIAEAYIEIGDFEQTESYGRLKCIELDKLIIVERTRNEVDPQ